MAFLKKQIFWLVVGDVICVFIVSIIGFFTHYGQLEGWRWLSTFIPVTVGWFVIAPWLGVYQEQVFRDPRCAWRSALAALLSAPLAATIRGFWLNSPILAIFVLILGLTNAFGFVLWRYFWSLVINQMKWNG